MTGRILICILIMAVITYLIRMLPLAFIRHEIKNRTLKSFLYYVPYVTLSVMTFPAIINATGNPVSGAIGFITALILAYFGVNLLGVAGASCLIVFIIELL